MFKFAAWGCRFHTRTISVSLFIELRPTSTSAEARRSSTLIDQPFRNHPEVLGLEATTAEARAITTSRWRRLEACRWPHLRILQLAGEPQGARPRPTSIGSPLSYGSGMLPSLRHRATTPLPCGTMRSQSPREVKAASPYDWVQGMDYPSIRDGLPPSPASLC